MANQSIGLASCPVRRGVGQRHQRGAGCGGREGARDGRDRSGRASRAVLISLTLVSSLRSHPQATVAQSSPGRSRSKPYKHRVGNAGCHGVTAAPLPNNLPRRISARYSPRPLNRGYEEIDGKPRTSHVARSRNCVSPSCHRPRTVITREGVRYSSDGSD